VEAESAMEEQRIEKLLNKLADRTAEPVNPALAEEIKGHIPLSLAPVHKGMHTVSIIVDLRVSKLAAAGIVVISMILLAALLGGENWTGGSILREGKLLAEYLFRDGQVRDESAGRLLVDYLTERGQDVTFYGNSLSQKDSNSILLHWRLSNGNYMVVFTDFREKQVTASELVELQARMLQNRQ